MINPIKPKEWTKYQVKVNNIDAKLWFINGRFSDGISIIKKEDVVVLQEIRSLK